MTVRDVPMVDLDRDPDVVGREIDEVCHELGFLQVVGHGVDPAVADAAWDAARAFFDLPLDDRMAAAKRDPGDAYGYVPLAVEDLRRSLDGTAGVADLKQTFNAGPVDLPARPITDAGEAWAFAPTPWPPALPELRAAWEPYFREMLALSARLLSLCARGLGLPPDWFDGSIGESPSALRAVDYPDQPQPPAPGQLRAGAHTDYGTLTILRQDAAPGGLEVLGPEGAWLRVPSVDGAFVVNVGDLLARWTDDRWRSTLHRVANPPPATEGTRRQSLPFFHNADYHAVIECLPTCRPADGSAPRHPPVVAGPHLMEKYRRSVAAAIADHGA